MSFHITCRQLLTAILACAYPLAGRVGGAASAAAQTIAPYTADYAAVRVYDTWEQSPFRQGVLTGHAAIVHAPATEAGGTVCAEPAPPACMVALQRSRFGSNTFGVCIDLRQPFRLTRHVRYLHVMVQQAGKPVPSRMMVVGLGRRTESEWAWQTGADEQFWAVSDGDVVPSAVWQDVVFAIRGCSYSREENAASGIDIHSLVVIPDLRSPHADAADFVCYFANIIISDSSMPRPCQP